VIGELHAAIPREARPKLGGKGLHVGGERVHHGLGVLAADLDQHQVAGGPLDQRRDVRVARSREQVALPVSRHGSILDLGRPLADRDRVGDAPSALPLARGVARPPHRATGPKMGGELLAKDAAGLHEQAPVDGLGRHLQSVFARVGARKPSGDLLG
jgi:uncharacterized protein YqfA (UPF0365 family)